jgi:hypothetical protein
MRISSPQDSGPVRSSMLGCSRPVRCTSVVTFSWTVATSAARSRSVANQPRPPTPASFTGPPPDGLRAPAARANTRLTSETGPPQVSARSSASPQQSLPVPLPSRGRPVFGAVTGLFLAPVAGTPPPALALKLVVGVIAAGAGPATLSPMAGTIAPSRQSACMVSRAEDVLRSRRRSKTLSPPSGHFAARHMGLERTTENSEA